ncbi:hypothetical protein vseg_003427 [Gypsophila vaccaria]
MQDISMGDDHKMVYRRWAKLCRAKEEGCINIKEILSWNKATYAKWICKLLGIQDNTWSRWVSHYVLKGSIFWLVTPSIDCSWQWIRLLLLRDELILDVGPIPVAKAWLSLSTDRYRAGDMYGCLLGPGQSV